MKGPQSSAAMKGDSLGPPAAFDVERLAQDLRYMAQEAASGSSLPLDTVPSSVFDSGGLNAKGRRRRGQRCLSRAYWNRPQKGCGQPVPAGRL